MNTILVDNKPIAVSKIVCVGRNYVDHVKELNNAIPDEPVFFLKPSSAISDQLHSVHAGDSLDYEGELCFVYDGSRFSAVGFGLDLTKRAVQSRLKSKGLPWERAKAFDRSAVFAPFVSIDSVSSDLRLELYINGSLVQSGHIQSMMFKPESILESLSSFMTLNKGDVVMTGTPKGVGPVTAGDTFQAKVFDRQILLTQSLWQAL